MPRGLTTLRRLGPCRINVVGLQPLEDSVYKELFLTRLHFLQDCMHCLTDYALYMTSIPLRSMVLPTRVPCRLTVSRSLSILQCFYKSLQVYKLNANGERKRDPLSAGCIPSFPLAHEDFEHRKLDLSNTAK